jgi:molybdopterin-guanine dinucleotide biosynthesis protein B
MSDTMRIVSLIGLKKCGKTTTAENLIKELKCRGYRVGSIKFMPNSTMDLDVEGKDTWRHRNAGSEFIISLSKGELGFIKNIDGRATMDDALDLVPQGIDILICEGYNSNDPDIIKILCARDSSLLEETKRIREVDGGYAAISGIVSGTGYWDKELPVLDSNDTDDLKKLVDLILTEP